jgi:hypothetical protein
MAYPGSEGAAWHFATISRIALYRQRFYAL